MKWNVHVALPKWNAALIKFTRISKYMFINKYTEPMPSTCICVLQCCGCLSLRSRCE